MNDSIFTVSDSDEKVSSDFPGVTDCPNPRRGFLIRMASAAMAVPAIVMMGADKPRYAPKQRTKDGTLVGGSNSALQRTRKSAQPDKRISPQPSAGLPNLYAGWNKSEFITIMADENAHVQFLVGALGAAARPKPNFHNLVQTDPFVFAGMARNFENTGTAAYLGALPLLVDSPYLSAAASIALIEARHSGYLNVLINLAVTSNIAGDVASFEGPLTPDQVVSNISSYVVDLNGGPPLIPSGGLSSPIDVLNFALALEYLESEFYNLNVSRFFP